MADETHPFPGPTVTEAILAGGPPPRRKVDPAVLSPSERLALEARQGAGDEDETETTDLTLGADTEYEIVEDGETDTETGPVVTAPTTATTTTAVAPGPITLPDGTTLTAEEVQEAIRFRQNWKPLGDEMAQENISSYAEMQAALEQDRLAKAAAARKREDDEWVASENQRLANLKAELDAEVEALVLPASRRDEQLQTQTLLAQMKWQQRQTERAREEQQAQSERTERMLTTNAVQTAMKTYFGGARDPELEEFLSQYHSDDVPTVAAGVARSVQRMVDAKVTQTLGKKRQQQGRATPEGAAQRGEKGGYTKPVGDENGDMSWREVQEWKKNRARHSA